MIGDMLRGFLGSQSSITASTVKPFLTAVEDCSLPSIETACLWITKGFAKRNHSFPVTAPELATLARSFDVIARDPFDPTDMRNLTPYPIGESPPEPLVPAGLVSVDYGRGKIDMTKLSAAEQQEVLSNIGKLSTSVKTFKIPAKAFRI